MLKKIAIFSFSVSIAAGCSGTATQQQATTTTTNANVAVVRTNKDAPVVSGHSPQAAGNLSGAPIQKAETKTKWTQSGSPIDTSAFDREIERVQEKLKAKPEDKATKAAAAEAFLKRGSALTEVGQYAAALGDYRRVLRYDASNEQAKTWIEKITEIYESINREAPKAGEEPPPLPFEKAS